MHRRSCSPPVVAGGTGFRATWISADALTFFISFIAGMVSCTMLLPASPFAATAAWVRATGAPSWTSATGHVPARAGVLLRHAAPKDGFADVAWAGGEPRSAQFGDVYFSAAGGLAEARHVFLRGTGLAGRIAARPVLTIAETGFGTGLNFLATWQLWDSCEKPAGATLQFVTVDKYPLRPSDLATALEAFPELQPHSQQLQRQYGTVSFDAAGPHKMTFAGGRVQLQLWIGDVHDVLPQWPTAFAQAWFLDGFSPALNADMWSDAVLADVARTLAPGGALATFTAVSRVRRQLDNLGLLTQKSPGFGLKREMTLAVKPTPPPRAAKLTLP